MPQIGGMYHGDRARKDPGRARLPAAQSRARQPAADLRGVRAHVNQVDLRLRHAGRLRAGASPAASSSSRSSARPGCSTRRSRCARVEGQVDDLLGEIRQRVERGERVLVTTLTKRMAEDLTDTSTSSASGPLPALRHRHARARRDPARPAPRRVRRARRHQPAARGARPARGLARRHPGRRQGGLPALGALAHPDRSAARRAT